MIVDPDRRSTRIAAAGSVAVIGALAYLWRLDVASWQGDEAIYADAAAELLASGGAAASDIGHPPLAMLAFAAGREVIGDDLSAVRTVSALGGLAVGVVLFLLLRRMAGWWVGLGAALAWVALPHALRTPGVGLDKLDRFGRLEAVAALPLALSLLAGWLWIDERHRRWAVVAGVLAGLAAAAKLPFGLAIGGVVLVGGVVHRDELRRVATDVAAMAAAAIGALTVTYLPFGTAAWTRFREMIDFQRTHAYEGHPILIGDTLHDHAPWWANFWFTWRDDGAALTIALLLLAAGSVAIAGPHRRAGAYLLVAGAVPAAVLATSPVALPHYRFVWLVPLIAAAVLGAAAGWRRGGPVRGVAVLAVAVLAVGAGDHLGNIATLERSGYAEAAHQIERAGLADGTLVHRATRPIIERHLPDMRTVPGLPADVVVLDDRIVSRFPDPALDDALDAARAEGACEVEIDDLVVVLPAGDPQACAGLHDR